MFDSAQWFIIFALSVVVFVAAVWGLIEAVRYPQSAYSGAGKNKTKWTALLAAAVLVAFVSLPKPLGAGGGVMQIFGIAAIIVVVLYFVDIRKKLHEHRPPSSGPGINQRGGW